jgi:hypothetical protein
VQPAARAVVICSARNEAAPRAVFAVPPRNRVPQITGAASGVETAPISGFNPRTSTLFPWILVWPNPAPCLAGP